MQISTRVGAVQVIPGLPSFDRYPQDRSGAACVQRRKSVLSPSELSTQSEFEPPYRSSPCGNRSCGRPAQQENEFSPLQFLELHLLAMVSQRGVCNNLAILDSSSHSPRDDYECGILGHSASTASRSARASMPIRERTQEQDKSVYRLSTITRTNSALHRFASRRRRLFAKAREAARFPGGLGTCSSSTLGGDFSGDHFYA